MNETAATLQGARTPWHLWVVGILVLLWNGSGAYTILMAQAGNWPGISPDEAAYYADQPLWFVALTDVALFAPIAGGVALLLRRRWAVPLFAVGLVAVGLADVWDLAAGTSRALANAGAAIVTACIFVIAVLELLYARAMRSRGVLR